MAGRRIAILVLTLAGFAGAARGDLILAGAGTSTDTGNVVSAQATFRLLSGNVLEVVLANRSPNPEAIRRGDTLTGVVWDIDGPNPTLSGLTISRGGSSIYTNATTVNNATSLAGRYDFKGAPGGPYTFSNGSATFEYGISAIGGGVFQGVGGDDYGLIASAASLDNPSFSASAFPLIVDHATFTLSGFTGGLGQIRNVRFLFGSGPNFVLRGVPEPGSLVLIGLGMALACGYGWRQRRRAMALG